MEQSGFHRATPNLTGRSGYTPKDLLKLYVYGYFNKIRSNRKLMVECTRNIELFTLKTDLYFNLSGPVLTSCSICIYETLL